MTTLLAEPYYSASHEVFRRATNQTETMLDRVAAHVSGRQSVTILSVGSGTGLFEIPMLARLRHDGVTVARFVGVEPSSEASAILTGKLEGAGFGGLEFEVITAPFESYQTTVKFDIIMFNHVLEYLPGDPVAWIHKSMGMLGPQGKLLIFSPTSGGINQIYDEVFTAARGTPPLFAEDIERALIGAGIGFDVELIAAACDVSALEPVGDDEMLMLLSFLTQRDCRGLPLETRDRYVKHYLSLTAPGSSSIPHPATLFVL